MGRVDLTLDEYRELRSHERQFVMLHGHARTEGAQRFDVVRKLADEEELARKTDPRS